MNFSTMKLFKNLFLVVPLVVFSFSCQAASVDTIQIASKKMHRNISVAVVFPAGYSKNKKAYPVLYLLHGGAGSFRDWLSKTPDKFLVHRLADQYQLIIVTPDAGPISYYFDSPLDSNSQYETFVSRELVENIDANYRTIPDRKGRVIAGLSMGGHGAIYIAAKHPELYCAAASMSGVMNINTATWRVPAEFAKSRAANFASLLGPPKDTINPYPGYTAVTLVNELKVSDLKLLFDCGVDDFLIDTNREMHQLLLANKIPHDYIERPGAHTWEYWENSLPYQLLFFYKVFKTNGVIMK